MFPNTDSLNADRGKDPLLSTLANQHCRFVIAYFRNTSRDHASIDEIAAVLARRDHVDETKITTRLHHAVLPKLDDVGIVDYDARTNTVRYHGHSQLEHVEDTLPESASHGEASTT